jgi:hypothetical protein
MAIATGVGWPALSERTMTDRFAAQGFVVLALG